MVCCCFCCAGEGLFSNLLSLILSATFSVHLFGAISPKWFCDGDGCALEGLYYSCYKEDCTRDAPDASVLVLAVMVLCSSLLLLFAFCFILHCSSYKYKPLGPMMALSIGGWYVIQELITMIILILIEVKYDKTGWSAYVFTVPGICLMGVVILMLIYQLCWPEKMVHPSD